MKSKVTVTENPTTKAVFTKNAKKGKDGKEYGFLRVEQTVVEAKGSLAQVKVRSALFPFAVEDFNKVASLYKNGTQLDGDIVRIEKFEPDYEGQPHKQVPRKDKNGVELKNEDGTPKMRDVTSNGQKIWSKDVYISDSSAQDQLLTPYDKYEETELAPESVEIAAKKDVTIP